jgi:hypothetical protein
MTFKVLTDDTQKIICCSGLRPVSSEAPNLRLDPIDGESIRKHVKFCDDSPREAFFKQEFENRISDKRKLAHNLSYKTLFKQRFTYRRFVNRIIWDV